MKRIILIMMAMMMLVGAAFAEEADPYRQDVTEEEFMGTWKLYNMYVEGYEVPTKDLGLDATVVLTSGQIEITDVLGRTKKYETVFEDGHLVYMSDNGLKMFVYITVEGLLHIDQEAATYEGTSEDEGTPVKKNGKFDLSKLSDSLVTMYFEKAE